MLLRVWMLRRRLVRLLTGRGWIRGRQLRARSRPATRLLLLLMMTWLLSWMQHVC